MHRDFEPALQAGLRPPKIFALIFNPKPTGSSEHGVGSLKIFYPDIIDVMKIPG
jgi:hypothetical protein